MIKIDSFTFYNDDNMFIMKTFKDKEFDLAIVDPPYGINIAYDPTGRILTNRKTRNGVYSSMAKEQWDDKPNKEYFNALFRVSKNQIIWGGNFFTEFLPSKQCWLVWDKINGNSSFSDCELAWTSFDLGLRICRCQTEKLNKIHITQKPIYLYSWILKKFAKENMKILDTHLGSGSIAIAVNEANILDKKNIIFTGIELNNNYFKAAIQRFKNHKRQLTLNYNLP